MPVPTPGPVPAPASLRVTLPSDTAFLHMVTNLARNAAAAAGLSPADAEKVALATDEAVTNVIEHAYHGRPGHTLEVRVDLIPDGIEVHVIHSGDPLDETTLPKSFDAGAMVRAGRRGGLGVVMMRRLMDRVDFRSTADDRSECCLRKVKPATAAAPRSG